MKKLLTKTRYLLAFVGLLLMGISSAQAKTETVFSAKVTATNAVNLAAGNTLDMAESATITGGSMTAINSHSSTQYAVIDATSKVYYFKMGTNSVIFKVELDTPLKNGDAISATIFGDTGGARGLYISTSETAPSNDDRDNLSTVLTAAKQSEKVPVENCQYVVTADDGLAGNTIIYLHRNPASTTNFDDFKITREVEAEDGEYDNEPATATFPFNTGAAQTATFSDPDLFTSSSVSLTNDFTYNSTFTENNITYTQVNFGGTKSSTNKEASYVSFQITPKKGLTFIPTKVSFGVMRTGTDGGVIDVSVNDKSIKTGINPSRKGGNVNNKQDDGSSFAIEVTNGAECTSESPCTMKIFIYNLDNGKNIGLTNIVIEGTVSGKPEQETLYTVTTSVTPEGAGTVNQNPAGEKIAAGKDVTFSAVANAGYTFLKKWTVDGQEKEGETYTVKGLSADVNVVAQFVKNPVITFAKPEDVYCINRAFPKDVVTIENGSTYTLPNNYMYYKEGYTMTGWTVNGVDGTQACGTEITVTGDITLTPVFTANNVSLDTRKNEVTVTYDFNPNTNGGRLIDAEGNADKFITTAEIDGETIDVVLEIDATKGKVNNVSATAKNAQVNAGAVFTIPVAEGSVITISGTVDFSTTTFDDEKGTMDKTTVTYTAAKAGNVKVVAGEANMWYNYISVTYPALAVAMTITDAKYATFSNASEVEIPEGVTAYYASANSENSVTLTEITDGHIPAKTGVVIAGKAGTYYATKTATNASLDGTNLLKAQLEAGVPSESEYYTLAAGPVFKKSSGGELAAGKAYLVLPAGARELRVVFGEATGISEVVEAANENAAVYNLNGVRVSNPGKGLYIVNGKKVVK